ncbi:MAG TPA: PspA/IM30 family protein [Gammaproteobacteria bacterium]|nr:PspA/IM30 family protein [Gammaproteobacteria bacterium]
MALVTRLSRLFQADFHAVLDRIEEPDLQLRQAVREMQFALDQDRQRQQLLQHEAEQLDKAVDSIADQLRSLDEELDICLAANKDDLARDLLRRKLAAEKRLQATRERGAAIDRQRQTLTRQVDEQTQQLTSMQQKLELLVKGEDASVATDFTSAAVIRNEEIEIALLREKQKRSKS